MLQIVLFVNHGTPCGKGLQGWSLDISHLTPQSSARSGTKPFSPRWHVCFWRRDPLLLPSSAFRPFAVRSAAWRRVFYPFLWWFTNKLALSTKACQHRIFVQAFPLGWNVLALSLLSFTYRFNSSFPDYIKPPQWYAFLAPCVFSCYFHNSQ